MRKALISLLVLMGTFSATAVLLPMTASAANCSNSSSGLLDFPTWYKYLPKENVAGKCDVRPVLPEDLGKIFLAAFEIVLRIGGIVAVVFVVYGGFLYLTSTGEPERAKNARTTLINAIAGLMITMFATAIVNLVARNITS